MTTIPNKNLGSELWRLVLDHSLTDIGIPEKVAALVEKHHGVVRVRQLISLTPEALCSTPTLGQTFRQIIYDCLTAYGFPVKNQGKAALSTLRNNYQKIAGVSYSPALNKPALIPYKPVFPRTQQQDD